jgi:hypothetical protein
MPAFARDYEEKHDNGEKVRLQKKIRKMYEQTPMKILLIEKEEKAD